ncbi:energy-coupling factor transporter transmembrane component T [Methanobrevibacter sp. V74]|uniref:energy-coupling factor transporter transmembrane component T family protein n=1 Tax=Methanobrevibacter sp. V74 TaxID=3064279 RepID=UPI0027326861|nr:energy-coupling factor transporter transmembrane component T [Methanobrevibacter sp. V74]
MNHHLDPRTKFFLIIVIGFMMFYLSEISYMVFILLLFIFLSINDGIFKESFKMFLIFAFLLLIDYLSIFIGNIGLNIAVSTALYLIERFFVFGMMGFYIFKTTKLSEFIIALENFNIPQTIILPFSVMIRFLPTIFEEYNYLKDSMKIRGITSSFKMIIKKPLDYMEYFLVPILIRSFKIADELSAYAMLRGLDSGKTKTMLYDLKFTKFDYLLIFVIIISTLIFYIKIF